MEDSFCFFISLSLFTSQPLRDRRRRLTLFFPGTHQGGGGCGRWRRRADANQRSASFDKGSPFVWSPAPRLARRSNKRAAQRRRGFIKKPDSRPSPFACLCLALPKQVRYNRERVERRLAGAGGGRDWGGGAGGGLCQSRRLGYYKP